MRSQTARASLSLLGASQSRPWGLRPLRFGAWRRWPARLAWSVHAADDELRKQLVPGARFPVAELRDAFLDVLSARRERALANPGRRDAASHQGKTASRTLLDAEVTLIDGVNDGPEHAEQMIKLLRPLVSESRWSKVNLIPYNWNPAERLRGDFAKSFLDGPRNESPTYRGRRAGGPHVLHTSGARRRRASARRSNARHRNAPSRASNGRCCG